MYHSTLYLYITVDVNGCGVLYFSSYRHVSLISTQTSRKKPDNEPERERVESYCWWVVYHLNSISTDSEIVSTLIGTYEIHAFTQKSHRICIHVITQCWISAFHYRCYRRIDFPPGVRRNGGNMSARCCQSSDRCELPVTAETGPAVELFCLLLISISYSYLYVCWNPIYLQQTFAWDTDMFIYSICTICGVCVCVWGGP